jgi:hypothetical protein
VAPTTIEEEFRKRLFSLVRDGVAGANLDNISGALDSDALAAFLTADKISDRVLGLSKSESHVNRVFLIATGNNVLMRGTLIGAFYQFV